jgi:hypothetical protein
VGASGIGTITLFIRKATGLVEQVIMAHAYRSVLTAKRGSANNPEDFDLEDFWETCYRSDLEPFLNSQFELWRFDWASEDDTPGAGAGMDPADALAWELPIVQSWLKDEKIYVHDVDRVADFIGYGSGFVFEDIASEFEDFDAQDENIETGDCPWCGVSSHLIRLDPPVTLPTLPEAISGFAKPMIWSDGTLSDGASDKVAGLRPNQFGDFVVSCAVCSSIFLASALQTEDESSKQEIHEEALFPGTMPRGGKKVIFVDAAFSRADYKKVFLLLDSFSKIGYWPDWENWTAVQQLVNQVSYQIRKGESFSAEELAGLFGPLQKFKESLSQYIEGTPSSVAPYKIRNSSLADDNGFLRFGVDELIPHSNIRRIVSEPTVGEADEREADSKARVVSVRSSQDHQALYLDAYRDVTWGRFGSDWVVSARLEIQEAE